MKLSEKGPRRCFPAVLLNMNSITLFPPVHLFEKFRKILNSSYFSLGQIDLDQRHFSTENYSHIMLFLVMVHEMRVCFSKNSPVIKVVVENNDYIPSNSQNLPEEFEIEESHLVELSESK